MTDPTITLAGQTFTVKPLVWKQLRVVAPAFERLKKLRLTGLTEAHMDDMAALIITGVSTSHPQFTIDTLNEMHISQEEMMRAVEVIAQQAGRVKVDGAPGEAKAAPETTASRSTP
jgi:hypothetical protein